MKLTRLLLVALAFVAFSLSVPSAEAQTLKIGVFDPARITEETAAGARIQARINALQEQKRIELVAAQEELTKLEQEFAAAGASMTVEKRKDMVVMLERKRVELDGMKTSAQRELMVEVEQAQVQWQGQVLQTVRSFGEQNGYTLVLQNDVVGYYASAVDVTDQLITLIDAAAAAGTGGGS